MRPPGGWPDSLRQALPFCGAYLAYRLVRGAVVDDPDEATANAMDLLALERALGLDSEAALHAWVASESWLMDAASWAYVHTHFAITTVSLAFVYLYRNASFPFVRDMFTVAMALALVAYVAYPTAPPRLLPELGFGDPVADATGVPPDASGALVNPYAAVPSMHVAFALMLGGTLAALARRPWTRAAWAAYPLAVTFVVVATANHWWADVALGGLTALVSAAAARMLAARHLRAFSPRPARAAPAAGG